MDVRDHLRELLTVDGAVLEQLATELVEEGLDEHANRVKHAVSVIDRTDLSTIEIVRQVILILRPVDYALLETGLHDYHFGLRRIRRRLAYEADRLVGTHSRMSTGEYVVPDDD